MFSLLRCHRGKRDPKSRRSTTSWSPALESLEELILLSPVLMQKRPLHPSALMQKHPLLQPVKNTARAVVKTTTPRRYCRTHGPL